LTVFTIPNEFAQQLRANCPVGFESGTFETAGIPALDVDVDGRLPACILVKEDLTRQDKIVFVDEKLVHLRID
jgi:hypothetical protein